MADDNNKSDADSTGAPGAQDIDNGTPNEDAGGEKLTVEQIKAKIAKGTAVDPKDLKRYEDNIRDTAVKTNQKKLDKDAKKKERDKATEDERKAEEERIKKLPEGEGKVSAELALKVKDNENKERAIQQREYRAVVKEAGFLDVPAGVSFDSADDVTEFVDFLNKHRSKPQKKGDGSKPGQVGGDPSPKQKSEEARRKENSFARLGKKMPWLKKKE